MLRRVRSALAQSASKNNTIKGEGSSNLPDSASPKPTPSKSASTRPTPSKSTLPRPTQSKANSPRLASSKPKASPTRATFGLPLSSAVSPHLASSSSPNTPSRRSPTVIDLIYNVVLPKELAKSKANCYITSNSPFAKSPQEIKGVYTPFIQHSFDYGDRFQSPIYYRCKHFEATYFPPWHILALGRKSRPSILFIHKASQYNGNQPVCKQSPYDCCSKIPTDYAVWRSNIRKNYRRVFFDVFFSQADRVDGLYRLKILRVPENEEELEEVKQNLVKLMRLTVSKCKKSSFDWVDSSNKKVQIDVLNRKLQQMDLPKFSMIPQSCWR